MKWPDCHLHGYPQLGIYMDLLYFLQRWITSTPNTMEVLVPEHPGVPEGCIVPQPKGEPAWEFGSQDMGLSPTRKHENTTQLYILTVFFRDFLRVNPPSENVMIVGSRWGWGHEALGFAFQFRKGWQAYHSPLYVINITVVVTAFVPLLLLLLQPCLTCSTITAYYSCRIYPND